MLLKYYDIEANDVIRSLSKCRVQCTSTVPASWTDYLRDVDPTLLPLEIVFGHRTESLVEAVRSNTIPALFDVPAVSGPRLSYSDINAIVEAHRDALFDRFSARVLVILEHVKCFTLSVLTAVLKLIYTPNRKNLFRRHNFVYGLYNYAKRGSFLRKLKDIVPKSVLKDPRLLKFVCLYPNAEIVAWLLWAGTDFVNDHPRFIPKMRRLANPQNPFAARYAQIVAVLDAFYAKRD